MRVGEGEGEGDRERCIDFGLSVVKMSINEFSRCQSAYLDEAIFEEYFLVTHFEPFYIALCLYLINFNL